LLVQAIHRNVYGGGEKINEDIVQRAATYMQRTWDQLLETQIFQIIEDLKKNTQLKKM
jgi:hypothetical protein